MPGNEPFQLFTRRFLCVLLSLAAATTFAIATTLPTPTIGSLHPHQYRSAVVGALLLLSQQPADLRRRPGSAPIRTGRCGLCTAGGDAPPHMDYAGEVKYPEIIAQTKQKGIVINTIQCGAMTTTTRPWMQIAQSAFNGGAEHYYQAAI